MLARVLQGSRAAAAVSAYSSRAVVGRATVAGGAVDADFTLSDMSLDRPAARPDETLEDKRRRLVYQSRKRGIVENCLILSTYVHANIAALNAADLELYDTLMGENDWDIFYWVRFFFILFFFLALLTSS